MFQLSKDQNSATLNFKGDHLSRSVDASFPRSVSRKYMCKRNIEEYILQKGIEEAASRQDVIANLNENLKANIQQAKSSLQANM